MTVKTQLIHFLFKLLNIKKLASKEFRTPKRAKRFKYPSSLEKSNEVHQFQVANRAVVTFRPKTNTGNQHIIFLHGGGYAAEAVPGHWWMIQQLLEKTKFKLTFLDYPLIPEAHAQITHEMVHQTYRQLVADHPNDKFYLVGDSAGGGLGLSFAQTLRDKQEYGQIEKIALLSPWVDVTMSHPDIPKYEPRSLILESEALIEAGKKYAGDLAPDHYLVSPINAAMDDLKSIAVFVGTREIFLPDCRRLKEKIEKSNTHLYYKEYHDMMHDWALFYVSERDELMQDVATYLLN